MSPSAARRVALLPLTALLLVLGTRAAPARRGNPPSASSDVAEHRATLGCRRRGRVVPRTARAAARPQPEVRQAECAPALTLAARNSRLLTLLACTASRTRARRRFRLLHTHCGGPTIASLVSPSFSYSRRPTDPPSPHLKKRNAAPRTHPSRDAAHMYGTNMRWGCGFSSVAGCSGRGPPPGALNSARPVTAGSCHATLPPIHTAQPGRTVRGRGLDVGFFFVHLTRLAPCSAALDYNDDESDLMDPWNQSNGPSRRTARRNHRAQRCVWTQFSYHGAS